MGGLYLFFFRHHFRTVREEGYGILTKAYEVWIMHVCGVGIFGLGLVSLLVLSHSRRRSRTLWLSSRGWKSDATEGNKMDVLDDLTYHSSIEMIRTKHRAFHVVHGWLLRCLMYDGG